MTEEINVSIVIPLFNESESLPELHRWIQGVMIDHSLSYEVIFIDDGSKDGSWGIIEDLRKKDAHVKGIKFQRNYGKSAALHVGFEKAVGKTVMLCSSLEVFDTTIEAIFFPVFVTLGLNDTTNSSSSLYGNCL